jgi:hypothetical protein
MTVVYNPYDTVVPLLLLPHRLHFHLTQSDTFVKQFLQNANCTTT